MWELSRAALEVGDATHTEAGSLSEGLLRQAGGDAVAAQSLTEARSSHSHATALPVRS